MAVILLLCVVFQLSWLKVVQGGSSPARALLIRVSDGLSQYSMVKNFLRTMPISAGTLEHHGPRQMVDGARGGERGELEKGEQEENRAGLNPFQDS